MSAIESITFDQGVRTPYLPKGMESIIFPYENGRELEVVMGDSSHSSFEKAKQLEHETFVALGDKPKDTNSDNEFSQYDSISTYAYVYERDSIFSKLNPDNLVGMTRLIPWTPKFGIKTVKDLSLIPFATKNPEVREDILNGLDVDEAGLSTSGLEKIILEKLCRDNAACQPQHFVDIATLAPDVSLEKGKKMQVINALLGSTTMFLLLSKEDHEITGGGFSHYLQFTETLFSGMMKKMGYPSDKIAGLSKVRYDTAGDGIAMRANPQISSIDSLYKAVMSAQLESHLGMIKDIFNKQIKGPASQSA